MTARTFDIAMGGREADLRATERFVNQMVANCSSTCRGCHPAPATGEDLESDRLKTRLGAALIERDLLNEKIAMLEANRPFSRRRLKS